MATETSYSGMKSPNDAEEGAGNHKHHHDTVEFVVHTKHTCDKCFQRPILGQRYTSSDNSNFDLCARCFEKYDGPDIGLKGAELARDIKISHDFVLKIKIDNGGDVQVRRMKVAEIWDKSSSNLSFGKVLTIAAGFAVLEKDSNNDAPRETFVSNARASYVDEDGDEVIISSDDELKDAFLQVVAMLPVRKPFLITVMAPKAQVTSDNKATGMPKRIQLKKVDPTVTKLFSVSMGKYPMVRCEATNVLRITPKDFENQSFLHARHTCDGCSKSPIIGTRYHATKIPDFDLCTSCFKEYEGDDLDFTPEIQVRDLRMQPKWCKNWATMDIPSNMAELNDTTNKVQKPETPDNKANALKNCDESLSDADGHGSIAAVIERTLDVCVAAIEDLQKADFKDSDVDTATTDDPVASSIAIGVNELMKEADEAKSDAVSVASTPSAATAEKVLKSEDCCEGEDGSEVPIVEDASISEEDGWSVVSK